MAAAPTPTAATAAPIGTNQLEPTNQSTNQPTIYKSNRFTVPRERHRKAGYRKQDRQQARKDTQTPKTTVATVPLAHQDGRDEMYVASGAFGPRPVQKEKPKAILFRECKHSG